MKRIIVAALIAAASSAAMASEQKSGRVKEISPCAVQMDASWDKATTLDAALDIVAADQSQGCISPVEAAERRASLGKKFMPSDFELHTLLEYRLLLETQLAKGKISPEEYRYKAAEALNKYMASAAAKEADAQSRDIARIEDERRRQEALAAVATQQEAANASVRAGAVAGALQGIGNAFRNYPVAPAAARSNCLSHVQGGTLVTSCY
jgi:Ni/Co efflux regulator RcnB